MSFIIISLLAGCSKNSFDVMSFMSDIRTVIFVGECDNAFITVSSGERENPYVYDGQNNNRVDFCIVSVWPSYKLNNSELSVDIFIDDGEKNIVLEKSPYENGYMTDLGVKIGSDKMVKIKCEELNVEVDLSCQSGSWEIQYNDAIKIGENALKDKMEGYIENNKLNGECYLKIIYDKSREIKTYYWYFTFIGNDKQSSSCVIDPNNGQVLAKI